MNLGWNLNRTVMEPLTLSSWILLSDASMSMIVISSKDIPFGISSQFALPRSLNRTTCDGT